MKFVLLLMLFAQSFDTRAAAPELRDGDLVFQTSLSAQSLAIRLATDSPWSHMGLVTWHNGELQVLEAEATVQYTPFARWAARGRDGHYVVRRLRDAASVLTPVALDRLHAQAQSLVGRGYDAAFAWSDSRLYCSELVWKIYERALGIHVGELQALRDFKLDDPRVQQALHARYGATLPLAEPVISPAAMYAAPGWVTVANGRWGR